MSFILKFYIQPILLKIFLVYSGQRRQIKRQSLLKTANILAVVRMMISIPLTKVFK